MGYEVALEKAWQGLDKASQEKIFRVKFLADEYEINRQARKVLSLSCNALAKDYITILTLHYLIKELKGIAPSTGEWLSFKELPGGLGYFDAFRRRAIEPIIRKYGKNPQGLLSCLMRLPGKKVQYGDTAVVLEAFKDVPVLITVFGEDQEFPAEANMLFERSIVNIFCSEDIAVLAGFIASAV